MRAALAYVALAASAMAANIPARGEGELVDRTYGHGGKDKPDHGCKDCETVTTSVVVTYTTVCPVTETVTKPGETYKTTYTTTSTVKTAVPTTVVVTHTAPPVTKTEGEVIYTTLTELCPVTETKVVDGSTVEITWTSTSTVVTKVQETQTVYTTSVATEYETTDVYETVTCPVTTYTTVSEGSTIKVTHTDT
ncbi:hypothetical protein N658DRAFT_28307 [Parathielavia hyrcaniae]|uniref:Ig-like domain-containing protein n=1 Tax=Parathielavia hyrcaniae TaxID=113614 RepID=A0AAN6QDE8_9PEZI|nr:hypothetical protein N658DRAFT_28307 [Parathielavia hyrcaniae]